MRRLVFVELPDGHFRAFAANGTTVAIDGATPFDLGGRSKTVMISGSLGQSFRMRQLAHDRAAKRGEALRPIHNEAHCNYSRDETYKSMSIARSADEGLTWDMLGQVITSSEGPASGRESGEGDCTAADGHDGFWYAYCQRLSDWKNFVARAKSTDPLPGGWMKWSGNGWDLPALGGSAAPLDDSIGMSSAYWTDANAMLVMAAASSLRLSVSPDKVHFATLAEPIILYDNNDWKRPAPTVSLCLPEHDRLTRTFNYIGPRFFLAYTYLPPGADFTQRYLVIHEATIELSNAPRHPQVRVALSRWKNDEGLTWATTGPPIFAGASFTYDLPFGYVMTAPPQLPSVKLDECFSPRWGGFLTEAGGCAGEGSERHRVAGYVFRSEQPGTTAIFSCLVEALYRFTSACSDRDGAGTRDRVLGFALR